MKRLVLLITVLFLFCSTSAFAKVNVVTSTFILSSIVKSVGGNEVNVSYIIPSASNPHIFSPKPKNLDALTRASLVVLCGFGLEFWYNNIRGMVNNKKVLMLSDFYQHPIDKRLINGTIIANPHIWLDMKFVKDRAAQLIEHRLCMIDSRHCAKFKKNADNFRNRLQNLIDEYQLFFKRHNNICFLDIKPAFEYFLRSFDRKSCYVVIKKGNEEPKIGNISSALKHCTCRKGLILYISNKQLTTMLSEKTHYLPVELNPLGSPNDSTKDSYIKLMRYNLNQLKRVLR